MAANCGECPKVEVWRSSDGASNHPTPLKPSEFRSEGPRDAPLTVIIGNADAIRECSRCRTYFSEKFKIPAVWWSHWCRNSNGYFGAEKAVNKDGKLEDYRTWFRFLVKQTFTKHSPGTKDYTWYKFNVFTRWVAATRQTIAIIFDPRPQIKDRLSEFLFQAFPKSGAANPFELHRYFLEELADLQDKAVWGIRDLVRNTEINRNMPSEARKVDSYFRLHEVGRHAIHVTETLTVAIDTVDAMTRNHEQYMTDYPTTDTDVTSARSQTRMHLAFFDNAFRSLLSRSDSNKSRLGNEIQLAYNVLTLYESQISIEIGRSAQIDSRAMKTVSFLTMSFLPATFISAIFSMSFFDFNAQSETFTISKSFWMYWAVTVPVTILSVLLWWYWETLFPIKLIGEGENAPQRLIHRNTEMELIEQESKKPSSITTHRKDNSDKV